MKGITLISMIVLASGTVFGNGSQQAWGIAVQDFPAYYADYYAAVSVWRQGNIVAASETQQIGADSKLFFTLYDSSGKAWNSDKQSYDIYIEIHHNNITYADVFIAEAYDWCKFSAQSFPLKTAYLSIPDADTPFEEVNDKTGIELAIPDWVINIPEAEDRVYFVGVAAMPSMSVALMQAESRARAQITLWKNSVVSVTEKESDGGLGTLTVTTSSAILEGALVEKRMYLDGTGYVLLSYPKQSDREGAD
jgi:hypothetical protein